MSQPTIFISYSHKDEIWKDRLVAHLGVLEQQGLLKLWHDRLIPGGDDWYEAIMNAIDSGSIAILLVSADSLTSNFILNEEVSRFLQLKSEGRIRFFPIIVSSCDWEAVGWLWKMNLRPIDAVALDLRTEAEINAELAKIAREIRILLNSLNMPIDSTPPIQPTQSSEPPSINSRGASMGDQTEIEFLNREEDLEKLCSKAAEHRIYIDAPAGFGKTYLLTEVKKKILSEKLKDDSGRDIIKGCALIDLQKYKKDNSIEEIINEIAVQVIKARIDSNDFNSASRTLRNGLVEKGFVLLLFDSVERAEDKTLKTLYEDLLPILFNGFGPGQLRVIFAGRYIASRKETIDPRNEKYSPDWFGYTRKDLSPFTIGTIKSLITGRYERHVGNLNGIIRSRLEEWCSAILDLSGGHPRTIKNLVGRLEESNWSMDFQNEYEREQVYKTCVEREISDVLEGISDTRVKEDLKILSVFRVFGADTIRYLKSKHVFEDSRDEIHSILAPLTNTGLVQRHKHSLRYSDSIVRNLILAQMKTEERERYTTLNQFALEFYDNLIDRTIADYKLRNNIDAPILVRDYIKESMFHLSQLYDLSKSDSNLIDYFKRYVSYLKEIGVNTDPECRGLIERTIEQDEEIAQRFKSDFRLFDKVRGKELAKELLDKVFGV